MTSGHSKYSQARLCNPPNRLGDSALVNVRTCILFGMHGNTKPHVARFMETTLKAETQCRLTRDPFLAISSCVEHTLKTHCGKNNTSRFLSVTRRLQEKSYQ
ncbi:hypothetical protein TNCV_560971 [Trichonephila clavipes]|nr:hypothetical protein TNCV_560971 [Trichonephila clavipes]